MFCKFCHHEFYISDESLGAKVICPNCTSTLYVEDTQFICSCSQCGGMMEVALWMLGSLTECPHCQRNIKLSLGEDSSKYFPASPQYTELLQIAGCQPGDIIGKYRIVRCLAIDKIAEVYLAEHTLLNMRCSLKLLKQHVDLDIRERWICAARLASKIQHPNLIAVLDAELDESSDSCYIVMEYVDGVSIDSILSEGPMLENRALEIVCEVAKALKTVAEHGIFNCNITPANIILMADGTVKLADWGIGKIESCGKQNMPLTLEDAMSGPINYSSPELLRSSRQVDLRTDIYSLGATLFHMLTGTRPFEAESALGVMADVFEKSSPIANEVNPEISVKTSELIARMMAKKCDERPANFDVLLRELTSGKKLSLGNRMKLPKLSAKLLLHGFIVSVAIVCLCVGTVIYNKCNVSQEVEEMTVVESPVAAELQKVPEADNFHLSADGKVLERCINSSIEKAVVPAGVTVVASRAFVSCRNLVEVVLPEGVIEIGEFGFVDCPELQRIEFPESLSAISDKAFSGCPQLNLVLPKNVNKIPDCVFESAKSVKVVSENRHFITDEYGVIFDAKKSRIVFADKNITEYTVPGSVTAVADRNFANCFKLRTVRLSENIAKIGNQAFAGCESLTEVVIPDSVKEIGFNIFQDCRNLKLIELPSHLEKQVSNSVLKTCVIKVRLRTAENGDFEISGDGKTLIKILKKDAEKAIIPAGIKIIGNGAFDDCYNLTEVVVPDGVTSIGTGAFANCAELQTLKLPESLTGISESAFAGCQELELVLPKNVKNLAPGALDGLKSVKIVSGNRYFLMDDYGVILDAQKSRVVWVDKGIKEYIVPDSVKTLDDFAFKSCCELQKIRLPDYLEKIGVQTFANCKKLTEIIVPDNVTDIEINAFKDCKSLKNVWLPYNFKTQVPRLGISGGITVKFRCRTANKYDLHLSPDGRRLIRIINPTVVRAVVPNGVVSIGSRVLIGGYTTSAGISRNGKIARWRATPESMYNGETNEFISHIKLPESLERIDRFAFAGGVNLKLTIPTNVRFIGAGAFAKVAEVKLAPGNKYFKYDPQGVLLTRSNHILWVNPKVKSLNLPQKVVYLYTNVFYACNDLEQIKFPKSLKNFSFNALQSLPKLKHIILPSHIKINRQNKKQYPFLKNIKITYY